MMVKKEEPSPIQRAENAEEPAAPAEAEVKEGEQ